MAENNGVIFSAVTGAATVTLKWPIEVGGKKVDRVTLRRVRGHDLEKIENIKGGETTRSLALAQLLIVDEAVPVGHLDGEDVGRLSQVIAGFLGASQQTGET